MRLHQRVYGPAIKTITGSLCLDCRAHFVETDKRNLCTRCGSLCVVTLHSTTFPVISGGGGEEDTVVRRALRKDEMEAYARTN